ncbi:MAG TPA: enoyl-CoA hydratase/isomerase family protein [Streptosporangiaceae bacterium]|nr:enoyl-CoA hydratase/isomerase family protein [Streptosporangiaceae bacterium]
MPVDVSGLGSPVAVITLDAPERLNAFGRQDLHDLHQALQSCENDQQVACVTLRGSGQAFCAGADLAFIEEIRRSAPDERRRALALAPSAVRRIALLAKPTVAAVQGAAFGGGACIALACDDVVLSDDARLGLIFTSLGLPGGDSAATWLLSRRIGTRRAWQLLAHGTVTGAAEALDMGLADEVVPAGRLAEAAAARAAAYSQRPAAALAATKRQLLRLEGVGSFLDDALAEEAAEMLTAFDGPDLAEALAARRQRRQRERPPRQPG